MQRDWEFWIDVGGTFTDFVCRDPSGRIRTHKLLSSGVYRGVIEAGSDRRAIVSLARRKDPPGFFDGFRILVHRVTTADAEEFESERRVQSFDSESGRIQLDRPLEIDPELGATYTLISGEEAPVVGIRWLGGWKLDEPIPRCTVRLGTTRGTNALLERTGAETAFVTTRGFADILAIGYQDRPRLFDLAIQKSQPLYAMSLEVDERIDSTGAVLIPLEIDSARESLRQVRDRGIDSIAICLLNAYQNAEHEIALAKIAKEVGFAHISLSTELSPSQRIVPRGDTTVVDAYLTPIVQDYVNRIAAQMPNATLSLMTSAGSLVGSQSFFGKDLILSGPAGGVVGAASVAHLGGLDSAIAFDMGGTSTDVSRYSTADGGTFERRYTMEIRDAQSRTSVRVVAPMLWIETVAAGGGSICDSQAGRIVVGPKSAGAVPGPACYGLGGPLTVTDVNLFLGRLVEDAFSIPLDHVAVRDRMEAIVAQIEAESGQRRPAEELAEGLLAVANANMAAAIKRISIARGHDVRRAGLVSFGGAGGQHACAVAAELGIEVVIQHPLAGVLSAMGIGAAEVRKFGEQHVGRLFGELDATELAQLFEAMERPLFESLLAEGFTKQRIGSPRRILEMRYRGQDATLAIAEPADGDFIQGFLEEHSRRYGFLYPNRAIEIWMARMELAGTAEDMATIEIESAQGPAEAIRMTRAYFAGGWRETSVYRRDALRAGHRLDGPAIVIEPSSTIVVEPGWSAEVDRTGNLVLRRERGSFTPIETRIEEAPDPVSLELFNQRFASIAEQMGVTLQKSAMSTNVKERLDFSCALFTATGRLVVNAPHIPVHLGAMGETVQRLLEDVTDIRPGESYLINDPFSGGSHLPDVTVISPVFDRNGTRLLFFTASRAHHAEIGGTVPGSMPPFSRSLAEEGVLLRWLRIPSGQTTGQEELRRRLTEAPFPSRSVEENVADVAAQIAANRAGAQLLLDLVEREGVEAVTAYMQHVQDSAAGQMRKALLAVPAGLHRFADAMDDGSRIAVTIEVIHEDSIGKAVVDFAGTSPTSPGNLNANPAIVRAAVLYCFRCLIAEDIPINDGVLDPVAIRIPEGSLLHPIANADPSQCPAVGGGNVETSQRIVDVVLGALGVAAASQGTMNNFLFGRRGERNQRGFGYYETICGGAGAGPGFDGASAVHTHMTNTRMTDPEVLEDRYPVRLKEFSIRAGSGGVGQFRGGDGVIREVEFLEPVEASLLTNRRTTAPFGLEGGMHGQPGRNTLFKRDGTVQVLGPTAQLTLESGDRVRIETPGGGGYGLAPPS